MNGQKFAAWIFCIISWCILIPILMYYLHIYIQVRNKQLIKKRYCKIVIFCNLISIVYIVISRPLAVLYEADIIRNNMIGDIEHLVFSMCIHLLNYTYFLRYWMLFYDIKWTVMNQKKTWYQYINTDHATYNNFWIKHRKTFGSPHFMLKLIILPIIIASVITTYTYFAYSSEEKMYEFVEALIAPIPLIGEVILWISTPVFHDQLKLTRELKIFLVYACGAFFIWFTLPIILGIYDYKNDKDSEDDTTYFWIGYIYIFLSTIFVWILALITTYWVLNKSGVIDVKLTAPYRILSRKARIKYQKIIAAKNKNIMEHYISIGATTTTATATTTPTTHSSADVAIDHLYATPINDPSTLTLEQLLSTEYGFDGFIHHLSTEFCVEILLSAVEFTQFQEFYSEETSFKFYGNVPQSSIVFDSNYSMHDKIKKLVEKYILNGSELELNISYRMRRDLIKLYNKLHKISNNQHLKCFFNDVITEMIDLMNDSFYRFKKTKSYKNLKLNKKFKKKIQKIQNKNQKIIVNTPMMNCNDNYPDLIEDIDIDDLDYQREEHINTESTTYTYNTSSIRGANDEQINNDDKDLTIDDEQCVINNDLKSSLIQEEYSVNS